MVRILSEMYSSIFIPKCACGMQPYSGEKNFGICQFPFYNEQAKILMCEKCLSPVFLGLVNTDEVKGSPELQAALSKNAFSLFSDNHLFNQFKNLKDAYSPEQGGETLADLGFAFEEPVPELEPDTEPEGEP